MQISFSFAKHCSFPGHAQSSETEKEITNNSKQELMKKQARSNRNKNTLVKLTALSVYEYLGSLHGLPVRQRRNFFNLA